MYESTFHNLNGKNGGDGAIKRTWDASPAACHLYRTEPCQQARERERERGQCVMLLTSQVRSPR